MKNEHDSSISVATESWNQLQHHFFEREGLLNQIEQGQIIKQETVQEVKMALTIIHGTWEKQHTVPRQQVLLLWSALLRVEQVLTNNVQDDQEEFLMLMGQLSNWLETVFDDPPRVLRELGRTQEAVDIAKRFVQFQGESPLSWQELGNAYATIGDNEEALEAFEKALSLGKGVEFPGVKELYMVQAEVLSRMGRYEEALAAYSHPFLSLRSQDSTVWRAKARVLRTLGRHDEEVQAEQKAQELEDRKARNLQARPH